MKRRFTHLLRWSVLLVVAVTPRWCSAANKPNILLILTDDQGWATIGCYGGKKVATPHLDRLAQQGARFTDAYVTSQCTPTRATLLTGQYTARHGLWHVLRWYGYPFARVTEPPFAENYGRGKPSLGSGLQAAGYRTAIVGKWHLTSNDDGNYTGLNPAAAKHYGFDFAPPILSKDEFESGADRGIETLTSQALDFIDANRHQPWFCFLSHHMIHGKVVAPEAIVQRYRDRGFGDAGPDRAVYLAGLKCIDRSVGRLMDRLQELGEADDTLVLFLSDNGGIHTKLDFNNVNAPAASDPEFPVELEEYDNAPLRAGKGSVYEGGVRVPLIARWPGRIPPKTVIDVPVHAIDVLPTCLAAAGATMPTDHVLDGKNLLPVATSGFDDELRRRPLFQYYPFYDLRWGLTPSASIRMGDYKLIEFFGDRVDESNRYRQGPHIELYNLRADLGESENLAPSEPVRVSQLRDTLHNWLSTVKARTPQSNPHFDAARAFFETREKPEWLRERQWVPAP